MKKYIVLSVNHNVDYMYFMPLTVWTWRKAGYEPLCIHVGKPSAISDLVFHNAGKVVLFSSIEGIRDSTVSQVSRLYIASLPSLDENDYIMLGDVDMLALGNHWNGDTQKVTVYNHDLTGFGEIPMCYVGMPVHLWRTIFNLDTPHWNNLLKRDMKDYANAKSDDFYTYWGCDQQILTNKLNEYGKDRITFINRGQYSNGFARGRVDRGAWTLDHSEFIDAHLMQQTHHSQEKIDKLVQLLHHVWPGEDFTWFEKYTEEFKKIAV